MKKYITLLLWMSLSAIYLFHQSESSILALRFNLWVQMCISAFVLAAGGAVLQILLRNPLADPWLLGVTGASSLGAAAAVFFMLSPILFWRTSFSLFGAFLAIVLLFTVGRKRPAEVLILIGVGINALCSALIVLLQGFLSPNNFFASLARISGYFSERDLAERLLLLTALLPVTFLLLRRKKELFILASGELLAQSVGVDAAKLKLFAVLVLSLALAPIASLAGTIGFIGLAVPHIIKRLYGFEHILDIEYLISVSGCLILGAALLLRLLPSGFFVPLGSVLALLGAPLFIWLLWVEGHK